MIEKYLNNRLLTLYLIPFSLGSLTVLSYQPFNFSLINFFILPSFFYLIIYIKKKSKSVYRKKPYKKNLFIFGTSFGFGYYLSGIHWITNSLTFDDAFLILIPFSLVIIPLFLSIFFSVVTLLIGPFLNFNLSSIFLLSGGLAFSDYLRAKILTGFPWNLWAYSFSWATEIIQVLNILGLFSFNLIIITIFMFPAVLFLKANNSKKILQILCIPSIIFIFYIYGNHAINKNQKEIASMVESYRIKVISPNFELKYGLAEEEIHSRLKKLIRYSEPSKNIKTLFIWPEGVFSGYSYDEILSFKDLILNNFSNKHFIIFGANKLDSLSGSFYNSMLVINNKFEIIQIYNKRKLVPFGEFLPFEKILNNFGFKKITEGHGSFSKGKQDNNLILNQLNILPLICYEIIFPNLIQKSGINTNLIINISEDGWFGNTIGPDQHFSKSIFRAIENNTFVLRSANQGTSAIIDNKGNIVKKMNRNEAGNIEFEVPLIKSNKIKNDLIFFILLITYLLVFLFYRKQNAK